MKELTFQSQGWQRVLRAALMSALAVLLCACGGGSTLTISAGALAYSQKATFVLSGSTIASVRTVSVSRCGNLTEEPSSQPETKTVSCTVQGAGDLLVELRDEAGMLLLSQSFTVPLPRVVASTSLGDLTLELDPNAAPATVRNFMQYVSAGFYDNTLIHRVVHGFIAQGGWLTPEPQVKPVAQAPIALESNNGLTNVRGSIGMARANDPTSATTHFYLNLSDNPGLNYLNAAQPGYAVFGRVVEGLEVLDKMGLVATGDRYGLRDFPLADIVVTSMRQTR